MGGDKVDRRAFGTGAIFADPADALFGEVRDGMDGDVGAGERFAVEAQDFADALEVDARRELLEDLFALAGFEAEVRLAALDALAEDLLSGGVPVGELGDADALQHFRR